MSTEIFYHIIKDDFNSFEIAEFSSVLSQEILTKCQRVKSKKEQFLKIIGWKYVFEFSNLKPSIAFGEHGKPFLNNQEFYFNISNSRNIAITIISNQEVGVDVEFLREDRPNIYARVFTKNEIDFIENSSNRSKAFTSLWTRKESVVKLFGGGISMGLLNFEVLENEIEAFGKQVKIQEIEIGAEYIAHYSQFI